MSDKLPSHRFAGALDARDIPDPPKRSRWKCRECGFWNTHRGDCSVWQRELEALAKLQDSRLTGTGKLPSRKPAYKIIREGDRYFGQVCDAERVNDDGSVILMVGRPWQKFAAEYPASDVQKIVRQTYLENTNDGEDT